MTDRLKLTPEDAEIFRRNFRRLNMWASGVDINGSGIFGYVDTVKRFTKDYLHFPPHQERSSS